MIEIIGSPTNGREDGGAPQMTDEPDGLLTTKAVRHIHKEALT